MGRIFRLCDGIPRGKGQVIFLLSVVGGLQLLDYLTTKIAVVLNGGGAVETNPLVRSFVDNAGFDLFLLVKVGIALLATWSILKLGSFLSYDLLVVGFWILGFFFVFLNNLSQVLAISALSRLGIWEPMVEADILGNAIAAIFKYGFLGILFFLMALYVWRRYKRLFCFGPAIICFIVVVFSLVNILRALI